MKMDNKLRTLITILVLCILLLGIYALGDIIIKSESESESFYKFPDDYIEVNCSNTFIGDINNGQCYQTINLDSFILKTQTMYTIYSLEIYSLEEWEKRK